MNTTRGAEFMITETKAYLHILANEAYQFDKEYNMGVNNNLLDYLDKRHKVAVVFDDLNGSVINGGFERWRADGYYNEMDSIIKYLQQINTENSKKLINILQLVKGTNDLIIEDDDNDEPGNVFEVYDNAYKRLSEEFLKDLDTWLKTIPGM